MRTEREKCSKFNNCHIYLYNWAATWDFQQCGMCEPLKAQTSLRISAVWSEPLLVTWIYTLRLLTEHHLEFLSLKGGCTGSSESTLVKMPHCWKSHVAAQCVLGISAPSTPASISVPIEESDDYRWYTSYWWREGQGRVILHGSTGL